MASAFLPEGSVPYRQYVRQPIPSLPRALKDLGYATTAIQADPKYWYNRERVYDLLGFDRVSWLRRTVDFEPAARGDWPSDQSIVRAIIRASQVAQPFFIFAFPSSTHGPFSFGAYRGSDLQVLDTVSAGAAGEVGEYINALRSADDAIGTLIEFFSQRPEPTIIAVLGDHLPPLSESALQPFFRNAKAKSKLAEARLTHRVPLLVWSNFDPTRTREELSVNALPSYLLEKMGIVPSGFLAVTNAVRLELPVLGSYVQAADGSLWDRDSVPAQKQGLIDDYRLIQYDLLLGGQYSLGDTVPQMRNRVPPQRR
jgi:arylsulfatase A-like enzyme